MKIVIAGNMCDSSIELISIKWYMCSGWQCRQKKQL